jgi:hypothetical protein
MSVQRYLPCKMFIGINARYFIDSEFIARIINEITEIIEVNMISVAVADNLPKKLFLLKIIISFSLLF